MPTHNCKLHNHTCQRQRHVFQRVRVHQAADAVQHRGAAADAEHAGGCRGPEGAGSRQLLSLACGNEAARGTAAGAAGCGGAGTHCGAALTSTRCSPSATRAWRPASRPASPPPHTHPTLPACSPEMSAYTYFSLWKPYWCSRVGLRRERITPCLSSSWLATSAIECRPSASNALRGGRGGRAA